MPCRALSREVQGSFWKGSAIDELCDFFLRSNGDGMSCCGVVLNSKTCYPSDEKHSLFLTISDCSLETNSVHMNCLGDANLSGVDRLVGSENRKGVGVFIEKPIGTKSNGFMSVVFSHGNFCPKEGDVVFLCGKVCFVVDEIHINVIVLPI